MLPVEGKLELPGAVAEGEQSGTASVVGRGSQVLPVEGRLTWVGAVRYCQWKGGSHGRGSQVLPVEGRLTRVVRRSSKVPTAERLHMKVVGRGGYCQGKGRGQLGIRPGGGFAQVAGITGCEEGQ